MPLRQAVHRGDRLRMPKSYGGAKVNEQGLLVTVKELAQ